MKPSKPTKPPAVQLKAAAESGVSPAAVRPVLHQPIVAVSLVLIAATLAQIAVYSVNAQLLAGGQAAAIAPSSLIANQQIFELFSRALDRVGAPGVAAARLQFSTLLVLAILSAAGWYAVGRVMLGPRWAIWCGILWGWYPLFGFLVQRPSTLTLSLFCVPFAWSLLLWWNRARRKRAALLAGVGAGVAATVSLACGLAFALSAPLLLATGRLNGKTMRSFILLWVGFALPLGGAWLMIAHAGMPSPPVHLAKDLLKIVEEDSSPMARAMHLRISRQGEAHVPDSLAIMGRELLKSPLASLEWIATRTWRTLYATADGHFERPLFASQLAMVVPGLWGVVVCLRQSRWRWPAVAGLILVATHWLVAAVAEPLARSLAPVAGMLLLFALVGVVDVYERAFGRRLTARHG